VPRIALPTIDDGARRRLTARFGDEIEAWFDELPYVLAALAGRWQIELQSWIPRGSMSAVIRGRMPGGEAAVLKVSPDRARVANEAAALDGWSTIHSPSVLAVDESVGALLIEAIEPGTPLAELSTYPEPASVAELLTSLHAHGVPDRSYPPVAERIRHLFDSGTRPYERRPELVEVVPPELYERGRRLATRLAENAAPATLLHGDLNPGNILDGGPERGLVGIDPSPCLGDAAFDAVDVLLWRAEDADTVVARAKALAPLLGVDSARLLDWCIAFAAMVALEYAEISSSSPDRIRAALAFAQEAPANIRS
jgi:streptomycin 6-kinase